MDIVFLFLGVLLGGVIGWLFGKNKSKSNTIEQNEIDLKYVAKERFTDVQQRLQETENGKQNAERRINELSAELAAWEEKHRGLETKLTEQKEELEKLQETFKNDFKVLAQDILDKNSQTFKQQNKEQISIILSPFKDKLESFEKKVEETYEKGQKDTISLKTEVKGLMDLNERLSKEATNLTKALKGDVKTQGNWGEVILERILEKSGLVKNSEYFVQNSLTTEDGKRYQPDVIIRLPEEKNVIVDSKVSLVAYERFANSEDLDEQQAALKQHLLSIKQHVKGLSEKNYQNLYGVDGLDFVLLFIPIEGAFTAAVQADNALFQDAFDKNVVIVSTSTLLATLRTIASIWKQEKQTQNAIEIARQGGLLYDKFVAFSEDLISLGRQMDTAKGSYEKAMNKLYSGNGNLINRTESLRKLGLKTTKQLDKKLIDKAQADAELED